MGPWSDLRHFAGFDWASEHHDVVVVDRTGSIVADFSFENSHDGWEQFSRRMKAFPAVGITIETSQGMAVEQLLAGNYAVYPVNPKCAQRYRERKTPAGVKTDRLDAWSLADALRLDGHTWRALQPQDPLIHELRQLCRDELALIEQRTAFVNQLTQALREYYPAALQAFDDWTQPFCWAFLELFPTPEALVAAGRRKWEKFLHVHKLYRPSTNEKRLACFARAREFCGSAATTAAKSLLALTVAKMLRALEKQLDAYRERIAAVFHQHPDQHLFGSLPGAGEKTAPRLLGEIGSDRGRFDSAEGLQCYAGTAPVTYESGTVRKVYVRRACNKMLRYTVHWLADLSRGKCAWAQTYYQKKRAQGKTHACALRCLGQRWLKILWNMWQNRTLYNGELHQRNQLQHGSWVLQLLPPAEPAAAVADA